MNTFLTYVRQQLSKLQPIDFQTVADATGVSLGTIRKIHYGEVTDPRVSSVQALYDYFKSRKKQAA